MGQDRGGGRRDAGDDTGNVKPPRIPQYSGAQVEAMLATRMAASAYDRFFRATSSRILTIQSCALALSLLMNAYQVMRPVHPSYVYADRTGRVMVLYSMDQPNMSDADAATWVASAISNALTLNYISYRAQMQASHDQYFTPHGWETFEKMLADSRLLQQITDSNYIMEARVSAAPVLEASGVMNGQFAWNFRIPITLSMHGTRQSGGGNLSAAQESHNMVAHVIMTRLPEIASERGVGIARIVMSSEN